MANANTEAMTPLERHNERRIAQRKTQADLRTRAARKQRQIERTLKGELERQGRVVGLLDEMELASLAAVTVQIGYLKDAQTRGANIDLEQLTRLLNTQGRLISALGLRPQVVEAPPDLGAYLKERPPT
jgi:hypothetical protein